MFRRKSVAKGLAAGAIGGLVGTIVMTQFQNAWSKTSQRMKDKEQPQADDLTLGEQEQELWRQTGTEGGVGRNAKVYSVRQSATQAESRPAEEGADDATAKVAGAIAEVGGKNLSRDQKKKGGTIVHYAFGTLMGAIYGVASELGSRRIRRSTVTYGLGFGAALFAGADEVAIPALKLSEVPSRVPASQHIYGFASHLIYGTTAAAVCKAARARL